MTGRDFPHRWPHISTGWKGADSSLNFLLQRHQSHPCLLHRSSLLPVQAFISQRHVVLSPVWGFRWLRMDPEGRKYSDGRISVWLRFTLSFPSRSKPSFTADLSVCPVVPIKGKPSGMGFNLRKSRRCLGNSNKRKSLFSHFRPWSGSSYRASHLSFITIISTIPARY